MLPGMSDAEEASRRDPWAVLEQLGTYLSSAPIEVEFVQTFIPMGFTSGDQESGIMALMLPDCIRWDYLEPFPKIFLLCDETAYAWNPGEKTGRRYRIAAPDQAGLELLRLSTKHLKERYSAAIERSSENELIINLVPKSPGGEITAAKLMISPAIDRLIELEFRDADGNLTNFEMTNHRALVARGRFTAPSQLTWLEN